MAEDWDKETFDNPEINFSLYNQSDTDRLPKIAFLRHVRQTHGTDIAINVRSQLNSDKVRPTDANFHNWEARSFATEHERRFQPPPPLLRKN